MFSMLRNTCMLNRETLQRVCYSRASNKYILYIINTTRFKRKTGTTTTATPSDGSSNCGMCTKFKTKMKSTGVFKISSILLLLSTGLVISSVTLEGYSRRRKALLSLKEWDYDAGFASTKNDQKFETQFTMYKNTREFLDSDQTTDLEDFTKIYYIDSCSRFLRIATIGTVLVAMGSIFTSQRKSDYIRIPLIACIAFLSETCAKCSDSALTQDNLWMQKFGIVSIVGYTFSSGLLVSALFHRYMSNLDLSKLTVVIKNLPCLKRSAMLCHFTLLACIATMAYGTILWSAKPAPSGFITPQLLPTSDMFELSPVTRNFTENRATVQYIHQHMAHLTALMTLLIPIGVFLSLEKTPPRIMLAGGTAVAYVVGQIAIGVLCSESLQEKLKITHQYGAYATMCSLIWVAVELAKIKRGRI